MKITKDATGYPFAVSTGYPATRRQRRELARQQAKHVAKEVKELLALPLCKKCGRIYKRIRETQSVCATCAWRNLEAFLAEPDPESAQPDNVPLQRPLREKENKYEQPRSIPSEKL